ncbi:c-type cytochrome biogenesis protein CcmI [Phenylobacterium sp.]|jgi:cytochrome c-type biogenesis protein CcmH|uniref:c-type cytochrome biogenesis protein CcmI n=1 Tax=Phenylobacterium sp. TaxID=1871053 RepID=UPI002F41B433
MIAFWIVAGVLSAAAAGLVLHRAAGARGAAADPTLPVYRRQLAEIDDLARRGLLADDERSGARAEAARRLLAAAEQPDAAWTSAGRKAVLAAAALAPALAAVIYLAVGAPGYRDQPFAARLQAWRSTPDPSRLTPPEMAAVLDRMTHERPADPEGFRYLAMAEAASGDAPAAVRALHRALKLAPRRADLWEMLGEVQTAQADGTPTPEARAAFRQALAIDPKSVAARFHLARARVLAGDKAGGIADARAALADLPPDDRRRGALQAAIGELEHPAVQAPAQDGTMAAIRGMVASLAARLETRPDDADGWVRLVRAYAVLGDAVRRDAALAKARTRYAAEPGILAQLAQAARAEPMK